MTLDLLKIYLDDQLFDIKLQSNGQI